MSIKLLSDNDKIEIGSFEKLTMQETANDPENESKMMCEAD